MSRARRMTSTETASAAERGEARAAREQHHDGRYYADDRSVFRAPLETRHADGTSRIQMGFRVCLVSDYVSDDAPSEIARALNCHDDMLATLLAVEKVCRNIAKGAKAGARIPFEEFGALASKVRATIAKAKRRPTCG